MEKHKKLDGLEKYWIPTHRFLNKMINSPKEVANAMNSFFVTKVKDLQRKLPPKKGNPTRYLKSIMKNRKCTFRLRPVTHFFFYKNQ